LVLYNRRVKSLGVFVACASQKACRKLNIIIIDYLLGYRKVKLAYAGWIDKIYKASYSQSNNRLFIRKQAEAVII
jgi:hypothetical protein